ncbi:hypothetical protein EKK58_05120 [Candidatus Dependentiae bacterium]|nr:MAG: hypothetical protein EKK58_05120 [Candidatus Dependentiae bacterium]
MKSNQLNIIAGLLLITAGLSAVNNENLKKVYAVVREQETMTVDQAKEIGLKELSNLIAAMNTATNKSNYRNAIIALANKEAGFVLRNTERVKRNIIDPIVKNRSTIVKATAAIAATAATVYAVDRYGFEGKGLAYTKKAGSKAIDKTKAYGSSAYAKGQEFGSWIYSKLPAKPTWLVKPAWFGMPTFVSNLFGKKEEVKTEAKQAPAEVKTKSQQDIERIKGYQEIIAAGF